MAIAKIAAVAFENATLVQRLEIENAQLKEDLDIRDEIIGNSPPMVTLGKFIEQAAASDATVLIQGET